MNFEDLAVFTFPFKVQHVLAFRMGEFPAGLVTLAISRTIGKDILRAVQKFPARFFSFPEIGQRLPFPWMFKSHPTFCCERGCSRQTVSF